MESSIAATQFPLHILLSATRTCQPGRRVRGAERSPAGSGLGAV